MTLAETCLLKSARSYMVMNALDELGDSFRTGMSANVEILGEKRDKALSLPLEALQKRDGETVAFVLKKDLDPKAIAKIQHEIKVAEAIQYWLADAIHSGINAQQQLHEQGV